MDSLEVDVFVLGVQGEPSHGPCRCRGQDGAGRELTKTPMDSLDAGDLFSLRCVIRDQFDGDVLIGDPSFQIGHGALPHDAPSVVLINIFGIDPLHEIVDGTELFQKVGVLGQNRGFHVPAGHDRQGFDNEVG